MRWRHPSPRTLRQWLDHGGPDDVDDHVARCARCAARLDELATPVPDLGAALSDRLRAPDDLVTRLGTRMTETMRTRADLQLLLELLGLPFDTIRTLMTEDDT